MKKKKELLQGNVEEHFYHLALAVSRTKDVKGSAELLRDLLSYGEAKMIAKRLQIAKLLIDGCTYREISKKVKSGQSTIARVDAWLVAAGEGYRSAYEEIKGKSVKKIMERDTTIRLSSIKRKYPMYYWPEIVLENIIKNANKRQKEQLKNVVQEMEKAKGKTSLFRKLKKLTYK